MPYSSPVFDRAITEVIKHIDTKSFFDIGAGAGKYGELVRAISSEIKTVAVEIEKDYINTFNLPTKYNEVLNISVLDLIQPNYYDTNFDVVMIGDTIEHLKKSDGIDLLNFLVYRCRWIIIQFPVRYLQNTVDSYTSEAHISVWDKTDFQSFERTKIFANEKQRLVAIRGYMENAFTIKQIETIIETNESK